MAAGAGACPVRPRRTKKVGVVLRGVFAGAVDEKHVRRIGTAFERLQILKKAGPLSAELERGCQGGQPLSQALPIGAPPRLPLLGIRWRVRQEDEADQQFQAGEVEIRARPVRRQHLVIRNLVGTGYGAPSG